MNLREDMSNKELLDLMIERGYTEGTSELSVYQIFNLVQRISKRLGIELNVEQKFFLMNTKDIVQCEATAGAGKTTMMMFKVIIEIGIRKRSPHSMCIITYTRAAVSSIRAKFDEMRYHANTVLSQHGMTVEDAPNIRSINSLSFNLVKQFSKSFELYNPDIPKTFEVNGYLRTALNKVKAEGLIKTYTDQMMKDLLVLYDYCNETLQTVEDLAKDSKVSSIDMQPSTIIRTLHLLKIELISNDKVLHSDCTRMVLELANRDKTFLEFMQSLYDYVMIDEFQDVSEAMYQMVLMMARQKKLTAVGDGDQSIYGFRGSRANNCERFVSEFKDASLCLMTYNRRCATEILEYATIPLELVSSRTEKSLKGIKTGGSVKIVEYSDKVAVLTELGKQLKHVHVNKLSEICIGYRKNFSCYYITNIFTDLGIPFRVKEDFMVGSDDLSLLIDEVLDLLKNPKSIKKITSTLYKLCGITRTQLVEKGKDKTEEFIEDLMDENDCDFFYEIPADKVRARTNVSILTNELYLLEESSKALRRGDNLIDVLSPILPQLRKNYWDYYADSKGFPIDLEKLVLNRYMCENNYVDFKNDKQKKEDEIKRYSDQGKGVQLSTFHSLKGLEFEEVHLVELAGDTFPSIIISEEMTEKEIVKEIDTELRLFYVACTRAKKRLTTYWDINNLSAFYEINEKYKLRLAEKDNKELNNSSDIDLSLLELSLDDLSLDNFETSLDMYIESSSVVDNLNLSLPEMEELSLSLTSIEDSDGGIDELKAFAESVLEERVLETLDGDSDSDGNISLPVNVEITVGTSTEDKIKLGIVQEAKLRAERELLKRSEYLESYVADSDGVGSEDYDSKELMTPDFDDVGTGDILGNILDLICKVVDV